MSRFVPTSTRKPAVPDASSLPVSTLGKRAAGEAGLDGGHARSSSISSRADTAGDSIATSSVPRSGIRPLSLSASTSRNAGTLMATQTRLMDSEKKVAMLELENEQLRAEVLKYKSQRNMFHEGIEQEKGAADKLDREWAEERTRLNGQMTALRTKYNTTQETLQSLRSIHTDLTAQHASLKSSYNADVALLQGRIKELEDDRRDAANWKKRAEALSIDLEEQKRKATDGRRILEDSASDKKGDEMLQAELKRQMATFAMTQQRTNSLEVECQELRDKLKAADEALYNSRITERALRETVHSLDGQLERQKRDLDTMTSAYSLPPDAGEDASLLQSRLAALSALHNETTTELAQREADLRALQARHDEYTQKHTTVLLEWRTKATEAERELRWAKEGRVTAEKREEAYRQQVEALTSGSSEHAGGDAARVGQLEALVSTLQAQVDDFARDSRETEARVTKGAGLVKQTLLDEAEAKIAELEKSIETLETNLSQLSAANTTLDAEVADLMRRVASGEYNPAIERALELRDNPASRAHAVRTQQLEELRAENAALLARLKDVDQGVPGSEGVSLVPRESYDRLLKEKEELVASHEKRLQRLKEIFMTKSKEFLEAVYSLLGWRIKFDESGKDIRLTSMYAPKGKMGLTLKFASQEGHFGTMQMMGGMARGLEDARRFWIMERQSVPGFLAQVTTEMFEKTTMGRNAGYIGLE